MHMHEIYSPPKHLGCAHAARRLLTAAYMDHSFFDVVDVDVHGSDSAAIGPALDAARFGGMLYLTSTDGFSAGGKRPARALAAYGAFTRAHPFCNEQGLRMLIGVAVREAATRGMAVQPLFSLYSPHGPVFRVMVRVTRRRSWDDEHYGFVGYSQAAQTACTIPFGCDLRQVRRSTNFRVSGAGCRQRS
jgi:tRNA (guanine26-N2/guanine27-N2)-dimethyltransferase